MILLIWAGLAGFSLFLGFIVIPWHNLPQCLGKNNSFSEVKYLTLISDNAKEDDYATFLSIKRKEKLSLKQSEGNPLS